MKIKFTGTGAIYDTPTGKVFDAAVNHTGMNAIFFDSTGCQWYLTKGDPTFNFETVSETDAPAAKLPSISEQVKAMLGPDVKGQLTISL
jgi:hypothetical protein